MFSLILAIFLCCLPFVPAVVIPVSQFDNVAVAAQITEPPPTPTGPICTLVDGGETGGTFCNVYTGDGPPLTDTHWVSTVTPPWLSSKISGSATSSSPSASPTAANCGMVGPFEITFDDLPPAGIPHNATSGPPMQYPASRLDWGTSWTYAPPPDVPYLAMSGDRLAHSVANANTSEGPLQPHDVPANGFGAGSRNNLKEFWFNIVAAFVQCDFTGVQDGQICTFHATPWKHNPETGVDQVNGTTKNWTQNKCTAPPCHLNKIDGFGPDFEGLSAVSFYAVIGGVLRDFYMDSVQMNWFDDSCEAGQMRQSNGPGPREVKLLL